MTDRKIPMTRPHFEEQTADFARQQAAQINALQTTVDGDGWLSTLVWNTRNAYLSWPEQTFTADHMRLIVEGFLAEVERLRGLLAQGARWGAEASEVAE